MIKIKTNKSIAIKILKLLIISKVILKVINKEMYQARQKNGARKSSIGNFNIKFKNKYHN